MNPYRLYALRLSARREVSPSFVRITLRGDDLATCSDILLDQRVKLLVGSPEGLAEVGASVEDWYPAWQDIADERRPAMRTYTLVAVLPGSDGSGEEPQRGEQIAAGAGDAVHEQGCKGSSRLRFKQFLLRCITIGGASGC